MARKEVARVVDCFLLVADASSIILREEMVSHGWLPGVVLRSEWYQNQNPFVWYEREKLLNNKFKFSTLTELLPKKKT